MHNSNFLSNMSAELRLVSAIVTFNKLESLLQREQCGRQDKSHFSSWGFSSELTKPYPQLNGIFFTLAVSICKCGSSENDEFWLNSEFRYTNNFLLFPLKGRRRGKEKGQVCSPPLALRPDLHAGLVPSITVNVGVQKDVKLGERRQRGK